MKIISIPIKWLYKDRKNARVHQDRNIEAIKESLSRFCQVKPIVVREKMGEYEVIAGNGTLQAAQELGWYEIQCVVVNMSDTDAIGYAIADNRTAELAEWDMETLAELDRILMDGEQPTIGFTDDELEILRNTNFKEGKNGGEGEGNRRGKGGDNREDDTVQQGGDRELDRSGAEEDGLGTEEGDYSRDSRSDNPNRYSSDNDNELLIVTFSAKQSEEIRQVIHKYKMNNSDEINELDDQECLFRICTHYLELIDGETFA